METQAYLIHPTDNVAVIICNDVKRGTKIRVENSNEILIKDDVPRGHKIAIQPISKGSKVYKYGFPIGISTRDISIGEWVHTHNLTTSLKGELEYVYKKVNKLVVSKTVGSFRGYLRKDGSVGVRNEVWILPMVSCVNHTGKMIAQEFCRKHPDMADMVYALEQPFGCSQLGKDHETTIQILGDIAKHPNAGGVILLSLGCENNTMKEFLKSLGDYNHERILPLITQQSDDEIADGVILLEKLCSLAKQDVRTQQPLSKLRVGFKCGASDGLSGVTANPLAGRVCEKLVESGASAVLTEVPEMFGAETILMNHARDEKVFAAMVSLINSYKHYYISHNQPIYENPSPGNKDGGITTLEEKSLGCVQKGGFCQVEDILRYGDCVSKPGLSLLSAPGNDPVSITALAAAGCQVLIFTTGRGNPLGSIVPTIKVASNSSLAMHKASWIDFNAGMLLEGAKADELAQHLFEMVLFCANGEYEPCSEKAGYKEIGIFKNGVTL